MMLFFKNGKIQSRKLEKPIINEQNNICPLDMRDCEIAAAIKHGFGAGAGVFDNIPHTNKEKTPVED